MTLKFSTAIIDAHSLRKKIQEQNLKLWWLAEQVKVDRKTISRWVNGRIKWVKYENLESLAEILGVPIEEITLRSEADQKATATDFRKAAELIHSQDLKSMVRNSYNWQLLEYIVKTSLSNDLPLDLLGSLYLDLAEACFFQNKISLSGEYVEKSLAIAEQLQHEILYWDGLSIKAKTETCFGNLQEAIRLFKSCLKRKPDAHREWRVRCNLSEAVRRWGDLEGAYELRRRTIADFQARSDIELEGMAWAKAWLSLGESCVELGRPAEALAAYERAAEVSDQAKFQKGLYYAQLLRAVCESQMHPHADHAQSYEKAHAALKSIQDDQLYYRDGALVYLGLKDFVQARTLLHDAIRMAREYPIEQGLFYQLLYHVEQQAGFLPASKAAQKKALEFFEAAGAVRRMEQFERPLFPKDEMGPVLRGLDRK